MNSRTISPPWRRDRDSRSGSFIPMTKSTLRHACRPIILNGISQFATRGDVLDRAIALTLPRIPEASERTSGPFGRTSRRRIRNSWARCSMPWSVGVRRVPDVHSPRLPRMADFVTGPWRLNRAALAGRTIPSGLWAESDERRGGAARGRSVGGVVRTWRCTGWEGTATELLAEVNRRTPEDVKRRKEWFAAAQAIERCPPADYSRPSQGRHSGDETERVASGAV